MTTTADIEAALRQALPQNWQHTAAELACLVEDAREGRLTQEEAQAWLNASPSLGDALRAVAGKQVELSSSVIAFGAGAQMGDVTISGDVAGGNIVKLTVNVEQKTVNTEGGDYAEGNIDKREGAFVSGGTVQGPVVGNNQGTVNTYYTYSAPSRSPQKQRNRRAMLNKVRAIWIDGLLNRSLTDELRIELNLTDRPDLLNLPLNAVVQELERPPQALPVGVPISEVFDQVGGELLILGAPGAGKTTLLLELLSDLLQRAEQGEAHPIPVVFPLSTWAAERKPLKDWLVGQLNVIYDVPKKIGQEWVNANEVLPLLDGLDEVAAEHRDACVEAINRYRQEVGGLAPTAVASRITDYEALKGKLRLRGAVLVEPLTRSQVEGYLIRAGEPLRAVRGLVEADTEVMELLDSPLMLSIVTLAFPNTSPELLRVEGSMAERKGRLWEAYIERMFTRRADETKYSSQTTKRRLVWLGHQTILHGSAIYYIEEMQPNWLSQHQRWWYAAISGLVIALLPTLLFGALFALAGDWSLGGVLVLVPVLALFLGPVVKLDETPIILVEGFYWSWSSASAGVVRGLRYGIGVALRTGPFSLMAGGLFGWFILRPVLGLFHGPVLGLLGGLLFGLGTWLLCGLTGLLSGLSTRKFELRMSPNQSVRRSIKGGLLSGLLLGLIGGLVGGLIGGLFIVAGVGVIAGLIAVLLIGGMSAFSGGLHYGGSVPIQHYILRYLLYRQGSLPFRDLIPWLDHCCDRLFLRRVGGGYIFIHRMLLEHFARKYEEQTKEAQRGEGA